MLPKELKESMDIIRKACASVVADLNNHQLIQNAINTVDQALVERTLASKAKKSEAGKPE